MYFPRCMCRLHIIPQWITTKTQKGNCLHYFIDTDKVLTTTIKSCRNTRNDRNNTSVEKEKESSHLIKVDARHMSRCVRPAWRFSSCERATGPHSLPACIRTPPHGCRWMRRSLRWCTAGWPCGWRSACPCSRSTSAPSRRSVESTWQRGGRLISENVDNVSAPFGAFGFRIVGQVDELLRGESTAGSFTVRYINLVAGLAVLVCHLHKFGHLLAGLLPLYTFFICFFRWNMVSSEFVC